ncbi:Ppx/GppA phosphatase family protein [Lutispora thermophila]|uniref:Exopolyphosphatase / guanosine-5'-triphosphate,3'-diphosphate pyrophosphatase n=1 Tax=Lutispora thermophila DSM 19022 TaxID=1122184 RepID=A0A1M6GF46_9FIRM|nr:Ppx/GppA phosphatase family protein [Lutispora thermophila]SHJ08549.1 exopolyphosphatase / guanosine-5'-triphosphate,3'-diphosphate pyrophosphatase [Lutispora thermophila DSM 19022]
MNKIAAIDLGTNSIRLMLCQVANRRFLAKSKEIITTRIGKDMSNTGTLTEKAMDRNIEAIKYFKKRAEEYGAEKIIIFATSAIRDASNKDFFLERVKNETGLDIMVLDGEEEAAIGMLGASYGFEGDNLLVIDVGGGSTELVLGLGDKIIYSKSINAGAVRMTERYIKSNPIGDSDIENLEKCLEELFHDTLNDLKGQKIDKIVAIGGTATTAASIFHKAKVYDWQKIHNTILAKSFLNEIFESLRSMSVKERYNVDGLQKERADIIPAGIFIIKHILNNLDASQVIISENDNLEGAIMKYGEIF